MSNKILEADRDEYNRRVGEAPDPEPKKTEAKKTTRIPESSRPRNKG